MIFRIEASVSNPAERQSRAADALADFETTVDRSEANAIAKEYHARGLWVEVFYDETRELLAGPVDPDAPFPSYLL